MSSFWRDRPVLVTGATGLVGGWLVKGLLQAEADVVAVVRDWVPASVLLSSLSLNRVRIVRGDVCDQTLMERVLGEYEVATVIHLAAQTIVPIANRNPTSTFESNIKGTWSTLEACRRSATVKQIVVASSDKAYGEHGELPYTEDMPLQAVHPYDVSKACSDLVAVSYASSFGLPVLVTRCGNFYGGGDLNWSRVVPGTIRSVLRGEPPVIRSDGQYIRDYFYVEDGAAVYMLLAEALGQQPDIAGRAYNFSNEQPVRVVDLVSKILRLMGSDLEPVVLDEVSNEIREQFLSAERARRDLGWQPRFALDDGLERAIVWYRAFLNGEGNRFAA